MADDAFFGLQDKANVNEATKSALLKVERAIEAFREHRPGWNDDRDDDVSVNSASDDFSGF